MNASERDELIGIIADIGKNSHEVFTSRACARVVTRIKQLCPVSELTQYLDRHNSVLLPSVPPLKAFQQLGQDEHGRPWGWVLPCERDPYSEPYLAVIGDWRVKCTSS